MSGLSGVQAQPLNNPSPFIQSASPQQIQIPDQAGRFNPLAAQAQALQNQGQANANQISQIDVQKAVAQRAIGQHIQQTLNADGTPNYTAAMTAASNDPHSALGMQDFATNAIANGNIQASTASTLLDNATKRYSNFANSLGRLAAKGPNVSIGDIANVGAETVASGLNTSDDMLTHLAAARAAAPDTFDAKGNPLPNPKLQQYVQGVLNGATGAQQALTNAVGAVNTIDTGSNVNLIRAPLLGSATPVGSIVKGIDPSATANLVTGQGDQGDKTTQTAGAAGLFTRDANNNIVINPTTRGIQSQMDSRSANFLAPGGYADNLNDEAKAATTTVTNIQHLQDLLPAIGAGSGSPLYNQLGNLVQAVGGNKATVNLLSRGDHDAWVEFQKTALLTAVTALKATVGGDRVASAQMQKFEDNLVSGKTSPGAAANMLTYMHNLAQQPLQEQQYLQKFSQRVGSVDPKTGQKITYAQWPSVWNRIRSKTGATLQGYTPDGQTPQEDAAAINVSGATPVSGPTPGPDGSVPSGVTP